MSADTDTILTPPSTDQSVAFLNDLFGVGWENIITGTGNTDGAASVLFEIFEGFNAVTLACVMVIVLYVIATGVMATAHEGESLGKRYSTLWTPLRLAISVSFLMPLPWVKLSLLQAIILKFIFFSIGGADYISNKAVEYMSSHGGAISMPAAPLPESTELAATILQSLVIQEHLRERDGLAASGIIDFVAPYAVGFWFAAPANFGLTDEAMGRVSIACNNKTLQLCHEKINAARILVAELRPVAAAVVSAWYEGADLPLLPSDFTQAVTNYAARSQAISSAELARRSGGLTGDFKSFKDKVTTDGWLSLGGYYYRIAQFNQSAFEAIDTEPVAQPPDIESIRAFAGKEINSSILRTELFKKRIDAIAQINSQSAGAKTGFLDIASALCVSSLISVLPGVSGDTQISAARYLSGILSSGDPILNLQQLGHSLINASSVIITGALGVKLVASAPGPAGMLAATVSKSVESSSIGGAIAALAVPVCMALLFGGFVLAYYLPLLPAAIWVFAVLGWLLKVFEAIVAMALWAAAHALPEGEGLASQHGRQGYLVFLEVLITPALMTLAFFVACLLTEISGKLIAAGLLEYASSQDGDDQAGIPAQLISWIGTIIIGAGIQIVAAHITFNFVNLLPEQVLRWIGAGAAALSDRHAESRMYGMVGGGMGNVKGATMGAPAAARVAGSNLESREKEKSAMQDPDNHRPGNVE